MVYENMNNIGREKVFHFCTIETKLLSPDDSIEKLQSLNNASQALHNMFEFFRDAGQDDIFFTKVRFFSVVASSEGLTICIHRATRESGTDQGFIIPDYPLRFEYQEFARVSRDNFDRKIIVDTFAKILLGYRVQELRVLLSNAAKAIMAKLESDPAGMLSRENKDFYRYGQTEILPSRRPTRQLSAPNQPHS